MVGAHPPPPYLRSTTAVHSRKSRLATLRRSRGGSTAVMAVLPRCYHSQWSSWHRHQPAVVTQWNRHVRSDTAVVPPWFRRGSAVIPLLFRSSTAKKTRVWRVGGTMKNYWHTVSIRWWRFWQQNRGGTAPPVWRGYIQSDCSMLGNMNECAYILPLRNRTV